MTATAGHTLVVTVHAIYAVMGLREHELVDAIATRLALEAVGVVRVVTGHDSFVQDGEMTDRARIAAVRADGLAIRE